MLMELFKIGGGSDTPQEGRQEQFSQAPSASENAPLAPDGLEEYVPTVVEETIFYAMDLLEFFGVNAVVVVGIVVLSAYFKQFIPKVGKRRAMAPAVISAIMCLGLARNPDFYDHLPTFFDVLGVWADLWWKHLATALILYGFFKERLKKYAGGIFDPKDTMPDTVSAMDDTIEVPAVSGRTERFEAKVIQAALAAQRAIEEKGKQHSGRGDYGECLDCGKPLRRGEVRVHAECEHKK